ncbi:unnamed protein product [Rotaria sp. Silwood1]|nr:unnamed protein product [Rotaria sp. Silwood1]CAF1503503.1 unnamed protein product [Rotaria sp. Silwood1]
MSRFLDIDLNDKKIPPNYSYRHQSLLSLEHALEPIVPRIDHLHQYIKEALEKCHFPSEHNLTHDESASIYLYTMEWGAHSLYQLLNKDLRSEDPSALTPWANYLKLFEIALTKLPKEKKRLWCGTKDNVKQNFVKGSEIIWRSVSSCSTTLNIIKEFLGNDTNATLFMVEAVNGRNLSGYTKHPDENEVLLGPGTRLSVESDDLKLNDGLKVVHLVEITDKNNETLPAVMNTISITSKPEILITMKHDKRSIQEFVAYCRDSHGNEFPKRDIEQFQQEYHEHSPIWWYTAPHFLYSVLQHSLETLDFEAIIKLGFFIRDLHEQLGKLHSEQFKKGKGKLLTVYRGQGLPKSDLQKLKSHVGGLLSFNHFLSTSPDRLISIANARQAAENQESVRVLFVITVDLSISSTPFANIRDLQYYSSHESVLFTTHSVFRIERIQQMDKESRFWQVQLTMMEHNDGYWSSLTEFMRNEIQGPTEYHRLGNLLRKICGFEKAFHLCMMPLKQIDDDFETWNFYYQLGMIKIELGDYTGAISYFQKSIQVYEKKSAINDPHLAASYTNLGLVYANLGEYSKAISWLII